MKALFGMRILPERKQFTDDEVVSQVREFLDKYDSRWKWLLGVHVVVALATVLMVAWGVHMMVKMAPFFKGAPGGLEIWFPVGLFVGWVAGHQFSNALHSFICVIGDTMDIRTKRLLLRYYDACTTTNGTLDEQTNSE